MDPLYIKVCGNCKGRCVEIKKVFDDDFRISYNMKSLSVIKFFKHVCDKEGIEYQTMSDHIDEVKYLLLESSSLGTVEDLEDLCDKCLSKSIDYSKFIELLHESYEFQ